MKLNKRIGKKDKSGRVIRNLDFIAESEEDKIIWDGEGIVVERPIGQVYRWRNGYNVRCVKAGLVRLINPKSENNIRMFDGREFVNIYLSCYDGIFYAWDNVEIISR